jgi:hypothetical protein
LFLMCNVAKQIHTFYFPGRWKASAIHDVSGQYLLSRDSEGGRCTYCIQIAHCLTWSLKSTILIIIWTVRCLVQPSVLWKKNTTICFTFIIFSCNICKIWMLYCWNVMSGQTENFLLCLIVGLGVNIYAIISYSIQYSHITHVYRCNRQDSLHQVLSKLSHGLFL